MGLFIVQHLKMSAKRRQWKDVIDILADPKYKEDWLTRFTNEGDTALHCASYDGQEEVVEELVTRICSSGDNNALTIQNDKGNTPLHLAAVIGNPKICEIIASKDEFLVDVKNNKGETPLFLAAASGNTEAFYCLYNFCRMDIRRFRTNSRKTNGDTILHATLRTEQYDLAFQIMNLNIMEVSTGVNGKGYAPLHILATKPSAFKSGSRMTLWQQFLYYSIRVDELLPRYPLSTPTTNTAASSPHNKPTCIAFFTNLWQILKRVFKKKQEVKDEAKDKDLENETVQSHPPPLPDVKRHEPERWSGILYRYWIQFFQIIMLPILMVLELGFDEIKKLRKEKQRHTWAVQAVQKLIDFAGDQAKYYDPPNAASADDKKRDDVTFILDSILFPIEHNTHHQGPSNQEQEKKTKKIGDNLRKRRTPMLLAAKYGVIEIVRRLHKDFPVSIRYTDFDGRNAVHLAAKYRHVEVYNFLLRKKDTIRHLFRASDKNGNTALHLAAGEIGHSKNPWRVTGPALQLQSEIKWYRMVEDSNENKFFVQYNKDNELAKSIFNEAHQTMLESGQNWLIRTSESCSLLAALIATVAFASATTVPGGNGENGSPPLQREKGFSIFAISSLTALCLSTTSVVAFLSILSSKFEIEDFVWKLPIRLLIGLSSLFFSIVAMLVSFCAGHYFMLTHRLQNVVVFVYIAASLPIALFFAIVQIHLYFDLLLGILSKVPT